ncbi:MAG: hypothetical protein IPP85_08555 [Propionivibrio sp.]|nr:hypothetical protein [Propionivibrio sp.]
MRALLSLSVCAATSNDTLPASTKTKPKRIKGVKDISFCFTTGNRPGLTTLPVCSISKPLFSPLMLFSSIQRHSPLPARQNPAQSRSCRSSEQFRRRTIGDVQLPVIHIQTPVSPSGRGLPGFSSVFKEKSILPRILTISAGGGSFVLTIKAMQILIAGDSALNN